MKYHQIKLEEIEAIYPRIVIADKLNQHIFKGSDDGYMLFSKTIAKEILKLTPVKPEEYFDDLFKLELSHSIEVTANKESNLSMFGLPWFAKSNNFLKILSLIEESVLND